MLVDSVVIVAIFSPILNVGMIIDSTSTDLPIARVSGINLPMAGLVSSERTNTNLTNYTDIGPVNISS